jgi:tripartite-type tricarboxylate transporter receptor subunit TctC
MKKEFIGAIAALVAGVGMAAASDYPNRPVSFVVPFPPGDLEDILTRMIAEDFAAEYGVAAAVVNKPGGGGGPFPGAIEVAGAAADGYTIGSFVMDVPLVGPMIGIPALNPIPFEPLGIFVTYPMVLAAPKEAPFNTMAELAAYSQDNDVVVAHFGPELTPTQQTLSLSAEVGVTYAADVGMDVVDCNVFSSGDADVGNTSLPLVLPCLDDLKVLVSFTEERIPLTAYAQAIGEIAPELEMGLWNGLFVHKDTPADVRAKIVAVAEKTIASERAQTIAKQTGAFVYWKDADASVAQMEADMAVMGKMAEILR